jgi:hypothetical protein
MSTLVTAVYGAASNLTDAERAVLLRSAVANLADSEGIGEQEAAAVLDRAAETGDVHLAGDAHQVEVTVYGQAVVEISRADLRALVGIG